MLLLSRTKLKLSVLCPALIAMLACFALPVTAYAQQQTGQIDGRIVDSDGASVPDATVTITDLSRGFTLAVKSSASGDYTIPLLEPGDHYTITAIRQGFKGYVQKDISLQVAQTAKIDITMQIGEVAEVVTVTGAPPVLEAETSSIGQVITGSTVEDLPLNGRSTFRLIALTPGVTFNQSAYGQFGDLAVNSTFDANFSINGGRAQANEFLIDGVPSSAGFFDQITTLPIVDDTDQFKVEANNLSAQYGRYAGGAINVSTKAGRNTFHGNVFEFFRNSALDANDWFTKHAGNPIPAFKLNIFGGTIGGPVSLPKLYSGKDHTFFFISYQAASRIRGFPYNVLVPSAAEKSGCFVKPIYNPFTGTSVATRTVFPQNAAGLYCIPSRLFDPVAVASSTYFPKPTVAGEPFQNGLTTNYQVAPPVRVFQNIGSIRIDENVTSRYHLFGRYAMSNTNTTQPNGYGTIADALGAVGTTNLRNQSFAFDNTIVLTPSLTLSVDYGYARWFQYRQTLSYGFDVQTLGMPSTLAKQISVPMFPTYQIASYGGTNNQSYLHNGNDSHAILASLTKTAGPHTVITGVDLRYHKINFFNVLAATGTYNFATLQTQGALPGSGDAFASFLLGVGNGNTATSAGSIPVAGGVKLSDFYGAAYFQDNWRVTSKLALNLGVRYDGESPYIETRNRLSYFDPLVPNPLANTTFPGLRGGLQYVGTNGHSVNPYSREAANIAPRLGFAFSAHPTTVFRGGVGMVFAPLEISNNAVGFAPNLGYSPTTSWNATTIGGLTPVNLLRDPFPRGLIQPTGNSLGAATQAGQSLNVWAINPPTPRNYQWNFDVQQQMPGGALLDMAYVGSRGLYLTGNFDMNTLNPAYFPGGSMGLTAAQLTAQVTNPFASQVTIGALSQPKVARSQLLLPFPQFQTVLVENQTYGSSTYHSAQLKFVKRSSHGITLLTAYTWSKLISNANASDAPIGSSNNTTVQNYYDLRAERSLSELDTPHNFVTNFTYELPFGHGKAFGANVGREWDKVIGGFKMNGIWVEQSGQPLVFTTLITGINNGRTSLVPGVNPIIPGSRSNADRVNAWFNVNAFATPAPYTFGNTPRAYGAVRGPGLQNLDASLIKDANFEHFSAEFRAEVFNVTNTPHFALPITGRLNAQFGQIKSVVASPPEREIQLALKLAF